MRHIKLTIPDDASEYTVIEDMDAFFTASAISDLDAISAEIKAGGRTYSLEEARARIAELRQ